MDEKIRALWANNKILFILLIIPIALYTFRSALINMLIKDSRKVGNEATAADAPLAQQQTAANAQANQIVEDANKLNDNKPAVGEDWNKK